MCEHLVLRGGCGLLWVYVGRCGLVRIVLKGINILRGGALFCQNSVSMTTPKYVDIPEIYFQFFPGKPTNGVFLCKNQTINQSGTLRKEHSKTMKICTKISNYAV